MKKNTDKPILINFVKSIVNEVVETIRNNKDAASDSVNILYSAVVIEDSTEIDKLNRIARQYIPEGWKRTDNYHMTIAQGRLPDSLRNRGDLNKSISLTVTMYGISDKAAAFAVYGYYSRNEMPHITIAYDSNIGGTPKDSKIINNWKPIDKFTVNGIIREVGLNNKVISEKDGHTTQTTTSRNGWAGPPNIFPEPENYDQFGNNLDDIAR